METIFHSPTNKTHFHQKGCALGLILNVRGFGTPKWPIYIQEIFKRDTYLFPPSNPFQKHHTESDLLPNIFSSEKRLGSVELQGGVSLKTRLEDAFCTKFLLQCLWACDYIESDLVYLYQVYINEASTY